MKAIALDVREQAIYWVRARSTRRGLAPRSCGVVALDPSRGLKEQVAAAGARLGLSHLALHASLHTDGLVHQREELPKMRARDAAAIAARRAAGLVGRFDDAACFAHVRRHGNQAGPCWLCAAPLSAAHSESDRWRHWGFEVQRLASRHLALGNLVRALPPLAEGELAAIVDLESERGTCVVVDREGWVFSREVPLRFMGERMLRSRATERVARPEPFPEMESSGLLLADEKEPEADAVDPLEAVGDQVERLATELRRTFRYVGGELGLGDVGRIYLAGEIPELSELAPSLAASFSIPVELLGDRVRTGRIGSVPNGAAVALGLALESDPRRGNLLPPEVFALHEHRAARRKLVLGLGSAVAAGAAVVSLTFMRADALRAEVARLEARWRAEATQRGFVAQVETDRQRFSELSQLLARIDRAQPPWTAVLDALGSLEPDTVFLERLDARHEEGTWSVALAVEAEGRGVADTASAVSRFGERVAASPLFAMDSITREDTGGFTAGDEIRTRVRFRIEGRLAPQGDPGAASPSAPGRERADG